MKLHVYSKGSASDPPFKVESPLPTTAFFINVVGERGSGKTVLIQNLITAYEPSMDYVIVLSPSVRRNDDYAFLKEDGQRVYKFDKKGEFRSIIEEMIESQDTLLKQGREDTPSVLLVLDDILESNIAAHRNIVETLAFNGRHMKISVILAGQILRAVSNRIRSNSDINILFSCTNLNELSKFVTEFVHKRDRTQVEKQLEEVFNERYAFISVLGKTISNRLGLKRNERIWFKLDEPLKNKFSEQE